MTFFYTERAYVIQGTLYKTASKIIHRSDWNSPTGQSWPYCPGTLTSVKSLTHFTITMTSWARWRLKSPASPLFAQLLVQAQLKENIKAPRHWPQCGEFTGDQWIPRTKGQQRENVSIWWRHHDDWTPGQMKSKGARSSNIACWSPVQLHTDQWQYFKKIEVHWPSQDVAPFGSHNLHYEFGNLGAVSI